MTVAPVHSTKTTYDYSFLRDIVGHLAVLSFVKAQEAAVIHMEPLGLATKECAILEFISNNPTASQKEIGCETGTKQALLVKLLDNLTAKGLLKRERSDIDRRRHTVKLTEAGEAVRMQVKDAFYAANRDLLAGANFTAQEEEDLVRLLRKLIAS